MSVEIKGADNILNGVTLGKDIFTHSFSYVSAVLFLRHVKDDFAHVPIIRWFILLCMEMPQLLVKAFDGDEALRAWVGTLRPSWQREIARFVMEPKSEEAKQRRCDAMAERLLLTMEAEREMPGFLAQRLKGTRDAMAGWERMTVNCRQTYLLTVFGAKSEAARENQVVRMVEACVAKGKVERKAVGP